MGNQFDAMTREERELAHKHYDESQVNDTIYYNQDSEITLNSGRIIFTSERDTPFIHSKKLKPNNRLIREFESFLSELGIKTEKLSSNGSQSRPFKVVFQIPTGCKYSQWRSIVWSCPQFSKSYIKVQVQSNFSDSHFEFCFIASTVYQIYAKMLEYSIFPTPSNFHYSSNKKK